MLYNSVIICGVLHFVLFLGNRETHHTDNVGQTVCVNSSTVYFSNKHMCFQYIHPLGSCYIKDVSPCCSLCVAVTFLEF